MNTNLLSVSIINMTMAIVTGVIILFFCYFFTLKFFEKKGYRIEKDNTAFGIFTGSIMLACGMIVSRAFEPGVNVYEILKNTYTGTISLFAHFTAYFLLFITIAFVCSMIIIFISMRFYNMLTRNIDEIKEIAENNISVAIIAGIAIIMVSFLSLQSISTIIESLIPYPNVSILN